MNLNSACLLKSSSLDRTETGWNIGCSGFVVLLHIYQHIMPCVFKIEPLLLALPTNLYLYGWMGHSAANSAFNYMPTAVILIKFGPGFRLIQMSHTIFSALEGEIKTWLMQT